MKVTTEIPYIDHVLAAVDADPAWERAHGRHMHLGYWDDPARAQGTVDDLVQAAERMSRVVSDAVAVRDGQRILDVGCGFGGTIAGLNERLSSVALTGVNIDERQLVRAREHVKPRGHNTIVFERADACQLPFPDASFDVVLAVECIVHFPSRARFLREARRVLAPGGRLMVSDCFVPALHALPFLAAADAMLAPNLHRAMGKSSFSQCPLEAYRFLAARAGLVVEQEIDITAFALPSFPVFESLRRAHVNSGPIENDHEIVWDFCEVAYRKGILSYQIITFAAAAAGARGATPDPGAVNVQGYLEGEDALALTDALDRLSRGARKR